jgi:hypothetical protein
MVRVRLRVCTHPARYLLFLLVGAISEKMARAFAEGVTNSKTTSLERCGLKIQYGLG